MADSIELFILVAFAILILLLTQSRELMRQIARTAQEWHSMRDAIRGSHREDSEPGDGNGNEPADPVNGGETHPDDDGVECTLPRAHQEVDRTPHRDENGLDDDQVPGATTA